VVRASVPNAEGLRAAAARARRRRRPPPWRGTGDHSTAHRAATGHGGSPDGDERRGRKRNALRPGARRANIRRF